MGIVSMNLGVCPKGVIGKPEKVPPKFLELGFKLRCPRDQVTMGENNEWLEFLLVLLFKEPFVKGFDKSVLFVLPFVEDFSGIDDKKAEINLMLRAKAPTVLGIFWKPRAVVWMFLRNHAWRHLGKKNRGIPT